MAIEYEQSRWNFAPFPHKDNTHSNFKGVSFDKARKLWRANIHANGKQISLGRFKTEMAAALAYNKAATKYYGEYAWLNNM